MLPQSTVSLDAPAARPVLALMDALEDLDDVQNVFTNFDVQKRFRRGRLDHGPSRRVEGQHPQDSLGRTTR